jgi:hypothetical protein
MTRLEQKQNELIELLKTQVVDLSMMSKIELEDDVIEELGKINAEIIKLKNISVPFIDEVEEFNKTFGKIIGYHAGRINESFVS